MKPKVLFILIGISLINSVYGSWESQVPNNAFDRSFYEAVLDPELCNEQIQIIRGNSLLSILFADAGIRTPRGILQGNNVDLGNYHQCLGINMELPGSELQGKYCMIRVPLNQTLELPEWPQSTFNLDFLKLDSEKIKHYNEMSNVHAALKAMTGSINEERFEPNNPLAALTFRLAVCIPKPCSTQQALTSLLFNISEIGFRYTDDFCRLPDDKLWVPGDYVVIVVFAVIGFVTLLSTFYDLWHTFFVNGSRAANTMSKSFSVYTNGRRLMNFTPAPGTLECLDGIRSISIAWIIMGHFFSIQPFWYNPIDGHTWQRSYAALWVTSGHVAVDSFFTMSGLLLVYTSSGKLNGVQLLKNIHLFYLNRLLRMFPLLATAVLLEATYMFRITDGPVWTGVANNVENCRANWWSTLLHIHNYATPNALCILHTWYLAVDTQLHILSPIILVFVLSGNRKVAWGGLIFAVLAIMISSTTYNFIKEFPSLMGAPGREHETAAYWVDYYINTLTRAPPFVVGMVFGYVLHLCRGTRLKMTKIQVTILWVTLTAASMFVVYSNYPTRQLDWSNQTLDSMFNSFIRPLWGLLLCCMIFACVNGYGGPVNWFLSLRIWKLPARISYAMYLYHFMFMFAVQHAADAPMRFSIPAIVFQFLAHYSLCFMVSFLLTLVVDSPFSTIVKQLLGPGPKKPQPRDIIVDNEMLKQNGKEV